MLLLHTITVVFVIFVVVATYVSSSSSFSLLFMLMLFLLYSIFYYFAYYTTTNTTTTIVSGALRCSLSAPTQARAAALRSNENHSNEHKRKFATAREVVGTFFLYTNIHKPHKRTQAQAWAAIRTHTCLNLCSFIICFFVAIYYHSSY